LNLASKEEAGGIGEGQGRLMAKKGSSPDLTGPRGILSRSSSPKVHGYQEGGEELLWDRTSVKNGHTRIRAGPEGDVLFQRNQWGEPLPTVDKEDWRKVV